MNSKALDTFKNFLSAKGIFIKNDDIVYFKDLTWLKGGEEALLITNDYFYYYQWGFKVINLSEIKSLSIGGIFDENIVFEMKSGQNISIWAAKYFDEIKEVIDVIKSNSKVFQAKVCVGCRATIRTNREICDYCRLPV